MSEYISTGLGYLTLFGVGYAVYHVSTQQAARKRGASAAKAKAAQPEARKEDRKKKQRLDSFAQAVKEKPVITEPEPTPAPAPAPAPVDESKANREFAKQLAKAKEGTKFAARSDGKQKEKSVKQSKANQIVVPGETKTEEPAEAASTDTQESENSFVEVERDDIPAEAGRVDDMLEPKQSGPSVLRLTEPTNKQEPKKKAAKAPQKTETKKQRQNRKKAEAAKAARDEAEVERKALEEKQRRAARIAEGRAAKDGSQFVAANGTPSSWNSGAPNSGATNGATNGLHEPLDTFEEVKPKPSGNTQQKAAPKPPAAPEPQPNTADDGSEWSTVTKSKSNKKKAGEPVKEVANAAAKVPTPAAATHRAPVAASKKFGGTFDALTTNDEEEEEEEWDV